MKNPLKSLPIRSAMALLASILMLAAQPSFAMSYDFARISNNAAESLSGQLGVDISQTTEGALFTFNNDIGIASSITDIYFDLGSNESLFSNITVSDSSAGVLFDNAPHPVNLPSGNNIGFTSDFGGDAEPPGTPQNGVNTADEWISFLGVLGSGESYQDFLAALSASDFRIGLHVQSIGEGRQSDAYVNTVPLPAAAWLFGSAIFGFFVSFKASRRRGS